MVDLEDVVDAVDDIEDITEDLLEPEELLYDLEIDPVSVGLALIAAVAGLFTLLVGFLLVVALLFRYGVVLVFVGLAVIGLVVTVLSVVGFLVVRSGMPFDVDREVTRARDRADGTRPADGSMSDEEAIEWFKNRYAKGEIDEEELERGLEAVIASDRPERVVDRHRE